MKQRFITYITAGMIAVFASAGLVALPLATVHAAVDPSDSATKGLEAAGGSKKKGQLEDSIKTVINVLLFVIGAVSVIMIVLGGIRYVLSNGDSAQVTAAKNTILYAVIGVIVALLAYAIVNFVITSFAP